MSLSEVPRWFGGRGESGETREKEEEARPNSGGEKRDALIAIDSDQDDLENRGRGAEKDLPAPQQASHAGVQRRHHRALSPLLHAAGWHLASTSGKVKDR